MLTRMELHPDLEPLAFLLGTWQGHGEGHYPTIPSFAYVEEITFGHVGKPFFSYVQKTRHATTDLALHAESGYFRPTGSGSLEFVVAQPSGIVEMHIGTLRGTRIELESSAVLTTPSAKSVTQVQRLIEVTGTTLVYELAMAAVGQPLQNHLRASLERAPLV